VHSDTLELDLKNKKGDRSPPAEERDEPHARLGRTSRITAARLIGGYVGALKIRRTSQRISQLIGRFKIDKAPDTNPMPGFAGELNRHHIGIVAVLAQEISHRLRILFLPPTRQLGLPIVAGS